MPVTLNEIIPWGRSRQEYGLFFALTPEDERGRILGCGDGPASFNAELTARGWKVDRVRVPGGFQRGATEMLRIYDQDH